MKRVRSPDAIAGVVAALALAVSGPGLAQEAPPAAKPSVASACKLNQIAELKVSVEHNQPLLLGKVNGQPVRMLVDTGSFATILTVSAAKRMGVPLSENPALRIGGAGGMSSSFVGVLKTWDIEGVQRKNFRMIVAGERVGSSFDMIVGQDFLSPFDLEFDMRHGVMRLMKVEKCKAEDLPYWAKGAYSQADVEVGRAGELGLRPKLNGRSVLAELDTGATRSIGTLEVATRAGVKLEETEQRGRGIGGVTRVNSRGVLDTFQLGDEVIRRRPCASPTCSRAPP